MNFPKHFLRLAFFVWSYMLFTGIPANAQNKTGVVTGVVTDAKTKEFMPLAVVFVANTTIGTTTDANGKFTLRNVPLGTVEIVASFIGYGNIHKRLVVNGTVELNLSLLPEDSQLKEVKILASYGKDWVKNLKRFRELFIGVSPNAAACEIKNPEVLHFDYDKKTEKLTASASAPLVIENRSLGYKLTFYLEKFESIQTWTVYYGSPKFEPLQSTNKRRSIRWMRNRQLTYQGSIYHMLRSLVYQNWEQEGFMIYHDQRVLPTNQFYQMVGQRLMPIGAGELIHSGTNASEREFSFDGKLEVIYTRKLSQFPGKYKDITYQSSSIEMNVPSIDINVEGWANGLLPLKISGDMGMFRIADLLPFDYLPEGMNRNLPAMSVLPGSDVAGNPALDSLLMHYNTDKVIRNQQKIYVHLDKPYYRSADEIWFKVYLTDLAGIPVADDFEIVTVELLSSENQLVTQVKLRTHTHWVAGSLVLADTLSTGMYRLRAYTSRMTNFDSGYFFDQPLEIYSIYPAPSAAAPIASNSQKNRRRNKDTVIPQTFAVIDTVSNKAMDKAIDVQFFPEGGNLVENLSCRMGFKAIGPDGRARKVKGFIEDDQGNREVGFESNESGMGSFFIKPLTGRRYHAVLENSHAGVLVAIPTPVKSGIALKVDNVHFDTDIFLSIRITPAYLQQDFFVVVQCRGLIYYVGRGKFEHDLTRLKIPKAKFPGGICQLTVFDQQAVPVCERLFFTQSHLAPVRITVTPEKEKYQFREKVNLVVEVTDTAGVALNAGLSLAITDPNQTKAEVPGVNAESYLLLTSDLRGYIENPGFYFKDRSPQTLEALDALLLTQGWRRFSWNDFVNPSATKPMVSADSGFVLTGMAVDAANSTKPLANHKLIFISQDSIAKGFIQTTTDGMGRFAIRQLTFDDSLKVIVQMINPKGQQVKGTLLWNYTHPDSIRGSFVARHWLSTQKADSVIQAYQHNATFMKGERPMRTQVLKEVVIKAMAPKEEDEPEYQGTNKLYDKPDASILVDAKLAYTSIYEIIRGRVPGVMVMGPDANGNYSVTIRGFSSFGSSEPLFLLDGMLLNNVAGTGVDLSFISPNDIVRIDIVKNSAASIYGSRGGNGIIAIYTRKGPRNADKKLDVMMVWLNGFQKSRQFYQPRYDVSTPDVPKTDIWATLYWNPDLKLDEEGKATISFFNSDMATGWKCVLEGVSLYGQPIIHSSVIENGHK